MKSGRFARLAAASLAALSLGLSVPFATAMALLWGPAWMALAGWQGWWWLLGTFSLVMAGWLGAVSVGTHPCGGGQTRAEPGVFETGGVGITPRKEDRGG